MRYAVGSAALARRTGPAASARAVPTPRRNSVASPPAGGVGAANVGAGGAGAAGAAVASAPGAGAAGVGAAADGGGASGGSDARRRSTESRIGLNAGAALPSF